MADQEKDGRVFFRVFYADSSSDLSMFQCKTTIYKSDLARDLYSPVWHNSAYPENMFQFEMLMPKDANFGITYFL